jgi:hypothetical protein
MKKTQVARLLAYVTGLMNQQLLLRNEYLIAENRILRAHLPIRLRLTDPQRSTLAEIGMRLGRQALQQVASVAQPETILAWYRKLIKRKFDGSKQRRYPGRPHVGHEVTELVVRMARENSGWGTIASRDPCRISVIVFRTRQSAISCAALASLRYRSVVSKRLERTSFDLTCRF